MIVAVDEFIRRFLLHIQPDNFSRIGYFCASFFGSTRDKMLHFKRKWAAPFIRGIRKVFAKKEKQWSSHNRFYYRRGMGNFREY